MKKFMVFMVVICLACSLVLVPCLADGPTDVGDVFLDEQIQHHETISVLADSMELVSSDVYTLSPITPSNTTGLTSILLSLIGNYDPVIVEYRYQNNNSTNYSYLREVQPDYPWLVSAGIFAIVLFCSLRILGGAVCKK